MKILVRLHQINAIVRSRGEHAARTINACAAAGLMNAEEVNVIDVRKREK